MEIKNISSPLWGSFFNFDELEQQQRYTLGKSKRLKSRKVIDLLFTEGKSFSIFPFRIVYQFGNTIEGEKKTEPLKAGFSASKKYFKKAVHRNRIKRLMREAYRLQKMPLEQLIADQHKTLVLFILFTGRELPDYNSVSDKMLLLLQKLQKLSNEKTATNI